MTRLTHALWAKLLAGILLVCFAVLFVATLGGTILLAQQNGYQSSAEALLDSFFPDSCRTFQSDMEQAQAYFYDHMNHQTERAADFDPQWEERYLTAFDPQNTNFYFGVYDENNKLVFSGGEGEVVTNGKTDFSKSRYLCQQVTTLEMRSNEHNVSQEKKFSSEDAFWTYVQEQYKRADTYGFDYSFNVDGNGLVTASVSYTEFDRICYTLVGYARENLSANDGIAREYRALTLVAEHQYTIVALAVGSFLMLLVLFIFLMCAAGHKSGCEGIHLNWFDRVPLDLLLILLVSAGSIWYAIVECVFYDYSKYLWAFGAVLGVTAALYVALCLSFFVTLAARIKAGKWYKNTVVCYAILLCLRLLRWLWRGLRYLVSNLPLYWRSALIWGGLCLIDFFMFAPYFRYNTTLPALWMLKTLALTALAAFALIAGKRLLDGGKQLAEGKLDSKIDLKYLYLDFKRHAEDLNAIGSGMQKAVEQQMRSERLKTELITNVSHDIKTPLTSIVNYVDLLKKEQIEPPKAREYLDVLDRQSSRLKKLTEDLVEASKASTGNLSCTLEKTDVNVLLGQVLGEYEERLEKAGLEPILLADEKNPQILADGRLLWRVFDNLLSNICKYAMPGTRVYLSSILVNGRVVITFKNISKYALNISPDELMERFVRGDSSRSTEGSGLGLSIANSLTTLQHGEFQLTVDGDLFKASVTFAQL